MLIVPDVWLPNRRETPGWDRAGRSRLPWPMCPAGQGVGSPRFCGAPSGLPGPRPLIDSLGREQAQACDIAILSVNLSDPWSKLPCPSGTDKPSGVGETLHPEFPEGTQESVNPGL